MRKLIAFFQRFRVFLVFLVMQILALGSYFSFISYPRTQFFNTSNAAVATMHGWQREVTKYVHLDAENKILQEEIVKLKEALPISYISVDQKTVIINDTVYEKAFRYIPAIVINSTHTHTNNFFTIKGGSKRGIKPKMGVISDNGVVGIVYDVSENFAVVKSILTENINLSAYIEGSDAFGILKYMHNDPRRISLTGVSNDIAIKRGARVLTRGSGGFFPKGIVIGKVDALEPIEGKPLWDIKVRLDADMRRLNYVYVIDHLFTDELIELQNRVDALKQ
jgi:rod shape-determining protein MreC